jgi:hypothetical protein
MMAEHASKSVGLDGDGDEIAAIYDVERAFGVKLNYEDAPGWFTAGDVFRSLQKALPPKELNSPDLWNRFAVALCYQTGVNPDDIDQESPLLLRGFRFWAWLADASAIGWIVVAATLLILLAVTVF